MGRESVSRHTVSVALFTPSPVDHRLSDHAGALVAVQLELGVVDNLVGFEAESHQIPQHLGRVWCLAVFDSDVDLDGTHPVNQLLWHRDSRAPCHAECKVHSPNKRWCRGMSDGFYAVLIDADDPVVEDLQAMDHSAEDCIRLVAMMDDVPWHWVEEADER